MLSAFTPDLRDRVSAVAQRALEAVISSHLVDNPVPKIIDDIQDAIGAAIKLAAMLKGKGTKESISDRLSDFVTMAADAVAGVLELHGIESADLLDDIQDVIAAAVDGAIDTGAIDIVDDRLWNDGIRKLWAIIEDIAERDAGNLLALAERAEKNGHPRIAARRRRAAARIFARQERRAQQ